MTSIIVPAVESQSRRFSKAGVLNGREHAVRMWRVVSIVWRYRSSEYRFLAINNRRMQMNKIIKENRSRLKVLRKEKKDLIAEILARKSRKKEIEAEMSQLRADNKREKAKMNEVTTGQADQTSAQKSE